MSGLAWLAQKQLERAVANGEFDHYQGKGEPLAASIWGDPHEGEWALAYHLLGQADMAPRWIELDKDIRRRQADLKAWTAKIATDREGPGWRHLVERVSAEASAINRMIETRNFLAPDSVRPRFKINLDQLLES